MNRNAILEIMKRVAHWQMGKRGLWSRKDWTWAALLAGMMEYSRLGDRDARDWLLHIGKKNRWKLLYRPWNIYHADDHAAGWTYLELHRETGNPDMIRDTERRLARILSRPSGVSLVHQKAWNRRYSWCDALFMAPPVLMNLAELRGKSEYREFADREWWASVDFLYSKEDRLFFRDSKYFHKKEKNGEKVFWGRGNGWVLAALPRILKYLPEDHVSRPRYCALYHELASRIVSLQGEDGWWHASLLDPASYPSPETSATALFCYGLAAGVNGGYLNESFAEPACRAWNALQGAVHDDGRLGWVQRIGENPHNTGPHTTDVYGVGAFLLAGSEILKLR